MGHCPFGNKFLIIQKKKNLQWLNDSGEVRVNKHVLVGFSIGKYEDEVLCDVLDLCALSISSSFGIVCNLSI